MLSKVLLINPCLPQKATRLNISISLLYLGSWLSYKGYEVKILDAVNAKSAEQFYGKLKDELNEEVSVVGLSVMTAQIGSAIEISKVVRELKPYIYVVWGGVHPTLYPEQVAESGYADFVVKGEGEETTIELLEAIRKKSTTFDWIKGVAFKNPMGEIRNVGDREPFDINLLPSPKLTLLEDVGEVCDYGEFTKSVASGIPIMTSRGCPHRCSFCIVSVMEVKYRFRRTELVLDDIEAYINKGITEVCFTDEDFFANKKRLIEILDGIEKRGLKFNWFGTARADYFRDKHINKRLLQRIKDSGCQQLGVGVESGSQRVLDKIKKDITVEDSLNASKLLNEVGIDISLSFMNGLPTETPEEIEKTLDLVIETASMSNRSRVLGPQIYRPYAGSVLYKECKIMGMREPERLIGWVNNPYIGVDIKKSDYPLFSWVQYPMGKLVKLNFYAWMVGLRIRWEWLTKLLRWVGIWRCRHKRLEFPIEMWLVQLVRRLDLAKRVSIGKFR